jgi:hypothetical protein
MSANFPGRCDFETSLCNWNQDKSDTFDWTRATDHTASGGTGPSRDHTRGTSNGNYQCSLVVSVVFNVLFIQQSHQ